MDLFFIVDYWLSYEFVLFTSREEYIRDFIKEVNIKV